MDRVCKELYATGDRSEVHNQDQCDGPPILKAEVEDAVQLVMKGKAAWPDNITKEVIKAVVKLGIEVDILFAQ